MRSCIGCNTSRDKRELCRVVRMPEGHIKVDGGGKAPGRGAYVCTSLACFDTAIQRRKFDTALRVRLQQDDLDRLRKEFTETYHCDQSA